jgi:hypothetical protein
MKITDSSIEFHEKIHALMSYFNISENAAIYMNKKRMYKYPYTKNKNLSFFKWSVQAQNAIIIADSIKSFDWNSLQIDNDIKVFESHGINLNSQSNICKKYHGKKYEYSYADHDDHFDGGGWSVFTNNKVKLHNKHILKKSGFL